MNKLPLKYLIAVQLCFCLVTALATGLSWHFQAAVYTCLSGLTVVLANAWYLWRLYAIALGGDSAKVLAAYHRAEVGKILIFALLLGLLLASMQRLGNSSVLLNNALLGGFVLNSVFVTFSNIREIKKWLEQMI